MILAVRRNCQSKTLRPLFANSVEKGATVYTDEYDVYHFLEAAGYGHDSVNHSAKEYARGTVHVNTVEGVWSLVVPWMNTFRGVCKKYLPLYLKSIEFFLNFGTQMAMDTIATVLDVCFRAPAKQLLKKLRAGKFAAICKVPVTQSSG